MSIATYKENTMTKNMKIKLMTAAFVVASAVTLLSMGSADAGMSSQLKHCKTNNRSNTISCCEAIVGQNLPNWMRESGRNCTTSATCIGTKKTSAPITAVAYVSPPKKKKPYCFISFEPASNQGNEQPELKPQPERPNNRNGNGGEVLK
jgi:hypothetical protein